MNRKDKLLKAYQYLFGVGKVSSQTDMAAKIGFNEKNFSSALNGAEKYLTDSLFKKIVVKFDFFNINYFISNDGNMLLKEKDANQLNSDHNNLDNDISPAQTIRNLSESNRILAQSNADLVAIIKAEKKSITAGEKSKKDKDGIREFFAELENILKSGSEKDREYYLKKMQELGVLAK